MDEPTVGLDRESAMYVMRTLRKYAKDKIVVVVTHDLQSIQKNDNTYKLVEKKLVK